MPPPHTQLLLPSGKSSPTEMGCRACSCVLCEPQLTVILSQRLWYGAYHMSQYIKKLAAQTEKFELNPLWIHTVERKKGVLKIVLCPSYTSPPIHIA